MNKYNVIGLGNAIVDILAQVSDEMIAQYGLEKDAMLLIDEPRAEELTEAFKDCVRVSGGSAANTMAGVQSFGGQAAYIGKVANDALGDFFHEGLNNEDVFYNTPRLLDGPATARCLIAVPPDARRAMNTFLGASTRFSEADVDEDLIASGQITYLEGYLFDEEAAKAAFHKAASVAQSSGKQSAITLSDLFCVERHREDFLNLISGSIDIVFANEAEILALYQTDNFDEAMTAIAKDTTLAAVTRGEKGSCVVYGDRTEHIAAEPVANVIDTTGAGDQYAAGFLFGITTGKELKTCANYGHKAAAEVISHMGPRPEMPYAELI